MMPAMRCRVSVAVLGLVLAAPAARATGPNNQQVPNPIAGVNTLNSVVQLATATARDGTGSVIDKIVDRDGTGYFCVLTADHVLADGSDRIGFINSASSGAPPAVTFPIINSIRHGGPNLNIDAAVALVRYGREDKFFDSVAPLAMVIGSVNNKTPFSEVGFGLTGTPVRDGAGNLIGLDQTTPSGIKRYQNNLVTAHEGAMQGGYTYSSLTYTFDAQGRPNFVAGEGFSFPGDSGAPYLATGFFDPGGGLPPLMTDSIIGIDTFGPSGMIRDGAIEHGVDIGVYAGTLRADCNLLLAPVPEPSAALLLVVGALGVWGAGRVRWRGQVR